MHRLKSLRARMKKKNLNQHRDDLIKLDLRNKLLAFRALVLIALISTMVAACAWQPILIGFHLLGFVNFTVWAPMRHKARNINLCIQYIEPASRSLFRDIDIHLFHYNILFSLGFNIAAELGNFMKKIYFNMKQIHNLLEAKNTLDLMYQHEAIKKYDFINL